MNEIGPYGLLTVLETKLLFQPLVKPKGVNMRAKEVVVLETLAEYRLLTMAQLSILCCSSTQMVGRKIRKLSQKGLVGISQRGFGKSSGRPENIYSLNTSSIKLLKDTGSLDRNISTSRFTEINQSCIEHQLLVNWTRILLDQIETKLPDLKVSFLSPVAHYDSYHIPIEDLKLASTLIPDGIFSIESLSQRKSLLFFLEVDMGTETLSSPSPRILDIRKKILCYQHIFRSGLYRKYENQFQDTFKGFRTLFITNTINRFNQLCRLARLTKPTDFIWLTDQEFLFRNGISDKIWVKGGDIEGGRFSILGPTLTFKNPFELS